MKKIAIRELRDSVLILDDQGVLTDIKGLVVDLAVGIEKDVIIEKYGGEGFHGDEKQFISLEPKINDSNKLPPKEGGQ